MSHLVALGLGTNREFNGLKGPGLLALACISLSRFIASMRFSAVYRTAAMYVTDQDDFYNMVVAGRYEGSPRSLLNAIHSVEAEFGRDREKEIRNGPRPLDIDIELFARRRIVQDDLVVPHERMTERAFVLRPLLDILNKNADVNIWPKGFYKEKLESLADQRIDLCMGEGDFRKLVETVRLK